MSARWAKRKEIASSFRYIGIPRNDTRSSCACHCERGPSVGLRVNSAERGNLIILIIFLKFGMKLKVDKENDTLYLRLDESKVVESEQVRPGVILDFDSQGRVVGVEFLEISSRATQEELSSLQFQTV